METLVDAKTIGSRGERAAEFDSKTKIGFAVVGVLVFAWAGFFGYLAFEGDSSFFEMAFMVLIGLAPAVASNRVLREERQKMQQQEPAPGTFFRCTNCKFFWTVRRIEPGMPFAAT